MPDKARHSVAAATVIAVHGAWAQIRSSSGKRSRVRVSRNLESLVCGDEVNVEVRRGTGRIIEVLPRKTLLARPLRSGSIRPVAANLDLAVLVVAGRSACIIPAARISQESLDCPCKVDTLAGESGIVHVHMSQQQAQGLVVKIYKSDPVK